MRRFALFGAVLLALAVVYAVAWPTEPRASRAAAQPAPDGRGDVGHQVLPAARPGQRRGAHLDDRPAVRRAATAAATAGHRTGSATLSPVLAATPRGRPRRQPVTVSAVNTLTTVTAPAATGTAGQGGTAVAATGQMAEGFEAEQADAAGMGLVSCTHPSSDMWFVGTGRRRRVQDHGFT